MFFRKKSDEYKKEVDFEGRMVIIGCGSIGQGILPLLFRHIKINPEQVSIITADERGMDVAEKYGVSFSINPLIRENYRSILDSLLDKGDFLLNLSVNVGSVDLIDFCGEKGVLYLDTCIEPWEGVYTDTSLTPSLRSNYAFREQALALQKKYGQSGSTAVLTQGANPGLVSQFIKQALLNLARDMKKEIEMPKNREEWAELSQMLGVKVIHIAERDTQIAEPRKVIGEFVNTWSIDGFVGEGCQPAELGWGSHEKNFPANSSCHESGCQSAILLNQPGASTWVRTWTPLQGPFLGMLITHGESISLADYFTVGSGVNPEYRPTVHYAYHPSDDTVLSMLELQERNWHIQEKKRLVSQEIVSGVDEVGVLLMGHEKEIYWYGSRLSIDDARALAPYNSATSLQVTAGALAGVIWAMRHPNEGVIDPEYMDFEEIMDIARPYLGEMIGEYGDWNPTLNRSEIFAEDIDIEDPWQFKNFQV